MGQGTGGAVGGDSGSGFKVVKETLGKKLVIENVEIHTKIVEVQVPKFVDRIVETPKFVPKEIVVTDVKVNEKVVETQTVVVKEVVKTIDKPSYKEVIVEVPKFTDREVINYIIKNVEKIVEVPKVVENIRVIEKPIEVTTYKLVEELIKVPKISYHPVEVERIVWKDVPREKCVHCGREVT